jgi:hypothetical protein
MNLMRLLLVTILFTLLSCSKGSTSAYLPSDDLLVLARFEYFLNSEGIKYQRDTAGMYTTVDAGSMDRLIELGHKALEIEPSRASIQIGSECASEKLQQYLRSAAIFYVIRPESDGEYLEMTKSDFASNTVTERYASYEFDCRQSLNK